MMITDNLSISFAPWAWRASGYMRKAWLWSVAIGPIYITAYPPLEK